jgi:23S rRNA (uracil1939-C5)-methyltransferase
VSELVTIRAIAAGGDGVGTLADGCTVFVPRSAPGDVVELADIRKSRRLARARIGRLVEPSPARVAPRCPHYAGDACGGCQLQHLSAAAQRNARRLLIGAALGRIGHLEVPEVPIEPSDTEWGYRTKISLAVKGPRIGFHRAGRPDEVFDLERCHVAHPDLNGLWAAVSVHRRLLPKAAERLVLRLDRDGKRHLIVRVSGTEPWMSARRLGEALRADGIAVMLWWEPEGGASRTVFGAAEAYPAMVFEQVHPVMGDRVRAHAVGLLGALAGKHCWDLYAGIGETTRALVLGGATVESVELDHRAVAVAEARGPAAGVARLTGRVEEALPRLTPADVVIVNPPRTGLGEEVTRYFAGQASFSRLVYVSCDPATLARDLARLADRYAVRDVRAFDLFPQTAHVETVTRVDRI